jgi:hypothetical protein
MLFKDTDRLREYAQVGNVNFDSIKQTLRRVEEDYIIPVTGKALYDDLHTAFTAAANEADLSEERQKLLDMCRSVVGPMFCYSHLPKSDILVSDAGGRREETATSKTAFQYQNTNYREANLAEGEGATESLWRFLENNATDYPLWVDTAEYKDYKKLFIRTASEFDKLYKSAAPYRNFYAMRSKMEDVEQNTIRPILTAAVFDDLKTKHIAGTAFSEKEADLMGKVKKAIAYYTVAFALPFLNVKMDGNGLTVVSGITMTTRDADNHRTQAPDANLTRLERSCADNGRLWIKNAVDYLNANATDFTNWIVEEVNEEDETTFGGVGLFGMT